MDSSYGPLFASYIGKLFFRTAVVAFIIGAAAGALIVWIW